jgi:hypothetical protein
MAKTTGGAAKMPRTRARKTTDYRERALKGWRTRRRRLKLGKR